MKEKLTNVKVTYIHDQGDTGQFKIVGTGSDLTQCERTIDLNGANKTHERLLLIIAMGRINDVTFKSITLQGGAVVCLAL